MEKITNAFYFYFTFIFSKICQVVSTLRDDNCQVIKQRIFLWIYKKKKNTHSKYRIFVETLQKKKKLRYQSSNSQELFLKKSLWRKLKMLYQKIEHSWGIILFIY